MIKNKILSLNKKLLYDLLAVIFSIILMIIAGILGEQDVAMYLWGAAFLIGGYAKAVEGVTKTIQEKSLNVEFLMIAASLAAFFTGEYAEGAILIFIFAVSGVLEEFATAQSARALTNLLKVAPKTAILLKDGVEKSVPISALVVNDVVIVKPGQQIPADGVILQGGATIDQASITGEFTPVQKLKNDSVFAGSIVLDSAIQVKVLKDASESVVQKMIDFVKQAQAAKTKSESRVSTFEKMYVYVVIALALFVIFLTPVLGWLSASEAFRRGVIILVVASPCALVASITPGILSTLSHAAHHGILIKSGKHLEEILKIKVVAFDKTGTITTGKPKVVGFVCDDHIHEQDVLAILVNAERNSNHPLAKAIVDHYRVIPEKNISVKEIPGRGLELKVNNHLWQIGRFDYQVSQMMERKQQQATLRGETLVLMIRDGQLVAFVALKDTIRLEAKQAIEELKALEIEPLMLTGDSIQTAAAIAHEVGITSFQGNSLPEDKVRKINEYKLHQKPILMIGDGINDAPSLASATIGISMGSGTDVSLETSDIVMMNNNLANVPYLIRLTQRMQKIIQQNVVFSIAVILILLISNLFGLVILRYGVFGHELSTIIVILNSLRLLRREK